MTELLTDEWFAIVTSQLAAAAGPSSAGDTDDTEVEIVVSGGDHGPVRTRWVIEVGRLVAVRAVSDDDAAAPVTIPQTHRDLAAMVAGELDPAVAFMSGDLKPDGSSAAVVAFMSAMNRPEARAALAGSAG
ncbi:MAG: SCP2 sterol-binding domain-containing protein [Acidimicrobiia bacterium]|nr:SCP2 sterol-binding domain-containing protein [Acidimicrobiia bacterium]